MSERQSRVPQEAEGQRRTTTDAGEARSQRPAERKDIGRAEVGKFASLPQSCSSTIGLRFDLEPKTRNPRKSQSPEGFGWLRGSDLNRRPLGYEPNELPGCSTPR